jgi:hypothetical protein
MQDSMDKPITQTLAEAATAPTHPEEMTASVDLRIGNSVTLKAMARTTPAGLVTAGILVSSIILAVATLVWAARRPVACEAGAVLSKRDARQDDNAGA